MYPHIQIMSYLSCVHFDASCSLYMYALCMDFTCTNRYIHKNLCLSMPFLCPTFWKLAVSSYSYHVVLVSWIHVPALKGSTIIILLSLLRSIILCFCNNCIFSTVTISVILTNLWYAVHWCWDHGISDCFCAPMPVLSDKRDAPASSERCSKGFSDISNMANCILSSGCCAFLPRHGKWSSRSSKRWLVPGSEEVTGEKPMSGNLRTHKVLRYPCLLRNVQTCFSFLQLWKMFGNEGSVQVFVTATQWL